MDQQRLKIPQRSYLVLFDSWNVKYNYNVFILAICLHDLKSPASYRISKIILLERCYIANKNFLAPPRPETFLFLKNFLHRSLPILPINQFFLFFSHLPEFTLSIACQVVFVRQHHLKSKIAKGLQTSLKKKDRANDKFFIFKSYPNKQKLDFFSKITLNLILEYLLVVVFNVFKQAIVFNYFVFCNFVKPPPLHRCYLSFLAMLLKNPMREN